MKVCLKIHPILTGAVNTETDVIAARQRARQIAALSGFSVQDQARIGTAVSEIARNAFNYARRGKVRFSIDETDGCAFVIEIEDSGPGIDKAERFHARDASSAQGRGGLHAAARLMDRCEITTGATGTHVLLRKSLPGPLPMKPLAMADAVTRLSLPNNVALCEAHQQNRELTDALAALQERQDELVVMSQRLETTNTQVQALNHQLNEKAEALQDADRQKNEFLSILSHELRGPLSAAGMAAHLLKNRLAAVEQTSAIGDLITRQIRHMERLVEDLLDVSRVGQGLLSIVKTQVDMHDVVSAAIEQITPAALRKHHVIACAPAQDRCLVEGDRTRLIQIVCNLVSNAIRYTPDGGMIDVAVGLREGRVFATVTDNGIGIPAALMPRLFDLYVQAKPASERQHGGLGLGLALVRSLMELHGGQVRAASPGEGKGSTFELTFPRLGQDAGP